MAYLAGGAHANARGDPGEAERLFTLSNVGRQSSGMGPAHRPRPQRFGFHLVREGRFAEALREDDAAVTILRAMGDASFRPSPWPTAARRTSGWPSRGSARGFRGLDRPVRPDRVPLEGVDHGPRSDVVPDAGRYRPGPLTLRGRSPIAQSLGDEMAHSEILAGLAPSSAEDPAAARELADQAIEVGRNGYQVTGLLVAARLAVERGDRVEAAILAAELDRMARGRRDRPALAGALEVLAQVSADPAERRARLDEASALWMETGSPFGLASCLLVRSRVLTGDAALEAAVEAERIFREIGARGLATDAAARVLELRAAAVPPVAVGALGGFRILRDGTPVAVAEWQSKKARDLLKILVARRGRPISREALFEALWPEEEPEPLANRLSVALTTVRGPCSTRVAGSRRNTSSWPTRPRSPSTSIT